MTLLLTIIHLFQSLFFFFGEFFDVVDLPLGMPKLSVLGVSNCQFFFKKF